MILLALSPEIAYRNNDQPGSSKHPSIQIVVTQYHFLEELGLLGVMAGSVSRSGKCLMSLEHLIRTENSIASKDLWDQQRASGANLKIRV